MFSSNTSQVSNDAVFVEDVFSTYLYTGNSSTQTINNGIDLAGKGGLVWGKLRNTAANHSLNDTVRGVNNSICSNNASGSGASDITAFTSSGFSLGYVTGLMNTSGYNFASWTFRKQPKFFDVVTYTGNGANRTIAHNLGSTPGCIIIKSLNSSFDWQVYHRGLASAANGIQLNLTNAQASDPTLWNSTAPTSTSFSIGTSWQVNYTGEQYVAYIFAHNAGGFGLTGTDNVISCGSFTTDSGGNATVNLGYEAQWVLFKPVTGGTNWELYDTMRGASYSGAQYLAANTSAAEGASGSSYYPMLPTATGFTTKGWYNSSTLIYIAIRRGPMKTPTSGTSVFSPAAAAGNTSVTTGFPVDLSWTALRSGDSTNVMTRDRLRGLVRLSTSNDTAETSYSAIAGYTNFASNTTIDNSLYGSSAAAWWSMRRAPGFFDEVCYTGTGSATTVTHNLGVAPELMIVKLRTAGSTAASASWVTYSAFLGNTKYLLLDYNIAAGTASTFWNNTSPTSSVFTVGSGSAVNAGTGEKYVAYLFATCPGVSKVGSYSGTGATQTISCDFTGGARFVLIKRTDTTGDWYVWDSARGMVAGTDPSLLLNSTAAEVNANSIYTTTGGFQIVSTAAGINASGGSYIYLAIA